MEEKRELEEQVEALKAELMHMRNMQIDHEEEDFDKRANFEEGDRVTLEDN